MVDIATKSLFHDRVRFLITLAGVTFAVTLVLAQVGLFLGLLDNASITIDKCNADLWIASRGTPNIDFGHSFSDRTVMRVRSTPGVEHADNLLVFYLPVVQPSGAEETTIIYAMEDFRAWGLPWDIVEGNLDDLRRGPNVFLDDSAARRFGEFSVGEYRESFGQRLRIVGRTRGAVSFTTYPMMFLDLALAQKMLEDMSDEATYVVVKVAAGADVEETRKALAQRLPHHDIWTKSEWRSRSRDYWTITTGLGFTIFTTVALGCLVGLVVVAQTLYTSTLEHIQEYGTLKAIGANNLTIYRILTKQAVICAVLGYVAGVVPVLVMQAILPSAGLQLILPGWLVVVVFFGTLGLCIASAMASFHRIASIDPAIVFRG